MTNQAHKILKQFTDLTPPPVPELTPKQRKYVEKHKAELVITPPLSLNEIIRKFDEKQERKTYVWKELWDQYDFGKGWLVDYVVPELMFINQTYEQQRESLKKAQKGVKGLRSINPRTYLILNAIRRERSEELLDATTWRRFIQCDMKKVDGDSVVGRVLSVGGRTLFGGTYGLARWYEGVGLSVGLEPQPLDFSTSSAVPFASDQEAIDFLKAKGYKITREF